jgi:hypothetical protein
MEFEADACDSTISFEPGIPVELGGTLDLAFADGVSLARPPTMFGELISAHR